MPPFSRWLVSLVAVSLLSACGLVSDDEDGDTDSRDCTSIDNDDALLETSPLDDECYFIADRLTADRGELVVEPGTTLYFDVDAGLSIEGNATLIATGEPDDPVSFRGEHSELGYWRGLRIASAGPHLIEEATVADAGSSRWDTARPHTRGGLVVDGDAPDVDIAETSFENHEFAAISTHAPEAELSIASSHFSKSDYALRIEAAHIGGLADDLVFDDNRNDVVAIHTDEPVVESAVWPALEIPYRFDEPVRVQRTVEVKPGTTLAFSRHAGLDFDGGTLIAEGTSDELIRFVGTTDSRGYWRGLRMRNTAPEVYNRLQHVEVLHAGSERWMSRWSNSQGGVLVHDGGRLDINRSLIAHSGYHGLSTRDAVVDGCIGLKVDDTHRHGLHAYDGDDVCFD